MESPPQQETAPPALTRVLAGVLVTATVLAQINGVRPAVVNNFALRPAATVAQSKLWNVITSGFFDTQWLAAPFNLALLLTMGKWIEASWGIRPMLLYIVLVNALAGVSTFIFNFFTYVVRADQAFFTPMATTNGIIAALLIAIKQLIPDHQIGSASVSVPANFLPLIYLVFVLLLTIVSLLPFNTLVFTTCAMQFAWLYLRFYRFANAAYGDPSETFAFATIFPIALRPPVAILSNFAFLAFRPLLLAAQSSDASQQGGQSDASDVPQPSKGTSMDTERRRQRALKVLDERLQAAAQPESEPNGESAV